MIKKEDKQKWNCLFSRWTLFAIDGLKQQEKKLLKKDFRLVSISEFIFIGFIF